MLYKNAGFRTHCTVSFSPSALRPAPSPVTMKAVLALAFFAVVGLAYAQDGICSLPAESRHAVVDCLKTHVSEETRGKFDEVKSRLQCEDLDCVFTKVCELSHDTHAQHADFFSEETKTALRAALTACRENH
ncbi:uncharacterized protein LOC144145948 [Haemaphysalis longicornis]